MGLLAQIAIVAVALIASARYGGKHALVGAALLGGLVMLVSADLVLLFGRSALCGILLDWGRRGKAPFGQMMTVALLPAGLVAATLALFPLFDAEQAAGQLMSTGAFPEELLQSLYEQADARQILQQTLVFLLRLAPGFGFLSALLSAFVAYVLCRRWLMKRHVELAALPPFSSWRIWDHFVWVLTLGMGLVLVGDGRANTVGWNLILVMGTLYWLQGLAVVSARLSESGLPRIAAIAVYVTLALTFSVSVFLVLGLGMLDIWLPLRRGRLPDATGRGS